ncbi:MAG: Flp pilus assembly complex ATPase component TadA [Rhodopseudomonas palustris]|nr:Flp pilus assembly complex ATPase component TadA [Rhodopseudomonas palustris]
MSNEALIERILERYGRDGVTVTPTGISPTLLKAEGLTEAEREEIGMLFGVDIVLPESTAEACPIAGHPGEKGQDFAVVFIDDFIEKAVTLKASDIHVEPSEDRLTVRLRLDGVLTPVSRVDREQRSSVISRLKVLASLDITETRKPQDGRIRKIVGESPSISGFRHSPPSTGRRWCFESSTGVRWNSTSSRSASPTGNEHSSGRF